MSLKGHYSYLTDIGKKRKINEDYAFAISSASGEIFLIVCDGMGGHNKGDVAAKMAVDYLVNAFRMKQKFSSIFSCRIWLQREIKKINKKIYELSLQDEKYHSMGTTIVCIIIKESQFVVAHMGDSRAYILKDGRLNQLTEDQTYVDYLYRSGKISEEEMKTHEKKNILTNALGIFPTVNLDIKTHKYNKETILLCSDGLYNTVSENELYAILTREEDLLKKCESAINSGNDNGGSDNLAIVIWEAK